MSGPSSRARESNLWNWLLGGADADTMLHRVENALGAGTPDVFGVRAGTAFVCELKAVGRRPKGRVWCELRSEQASFLRRWHRVGGRAFVLVQVGVGHNVKRYLVSAEHCLELLQEMDESRLEELSVNRGWQSVMSPANSCLAAMSL